MAVETLNATQSFIRHGSHSMRFRRF